MRGAKVAVGFVPLVVLSVLAPRLGAGSAAGLGALAAGVIVATTARGGVKTVPVVQAVVLLALAVLGLTGGATADATLVRLGPAAAALLLGTFMIVTAPRFPFTAQTARLSVAPQYWHEPRFLAVNRYVSTVWGLAVLLLGGCRLAAAGLARDGEAGAIGNLELLVRVAVTWLVPVAGFCGAAVATRQVVSRARNDAARGDQALVGHTGAGESVGAADTCRTSPKTHR